MMKDQIIQLFPVDSRKFIQSSNHVHPEHIIVVQFCEGIMIPPPFIELLLPHKNQPKHHTLDNLERIQSARDNDIPGNWVPDN